MDQMEAPTEPVTNMQDKRSTQKSRAISSQNKRNLELK